MDSLVYDLVDSFECNVRVYLRFDRASLEQVWDRVETVSFDLRYALDEAEPETEWLVDMTEEGNGVIDIKGVKTETMYEMKFWLELVNGRRSVDSRDYAVS